MLNILKTFIQKGTKKKLKLPKTKFCEKYNLTENQFFGFDKFYGNLDLSSLTTTPKGFNPTVGGVIYTNKGLNIPKKK